MLRLCRRPAIDREEGRGAPFSAAHGGAAVLDRGDRGLWAVADGIGTRTGDRAAAAAVIEALGALADAGRPSPGSVRCVLGRANEAVRATRPDPRRSAGASVVVLHLDGVMATILWAGDCRAYRCRAGALDPLTRDHSALHELIDAGVPIPSRAGGHPHLVTRAIGLGALIEIESVSLPVAPGDRLLLCARGLPAAIPASMIAGRLRLPPALAVDALVEAVAGVGEAPAGAMTIAEIR